MRINDDFSKPAFVHATQLDWLASPALGVDRKMLFRIGEEKARATSIVRYAPGSTFPAHMHTGGEEFVVLDGVFQDEHGDYPAGSYIRNPPGTSHTPASAWGCTIFVRLWQFRAGDQSQTVRRPGECRKHVPRPGVEASTLLFDDGYEEVRLEGWHAGATVEIPNPTGLEFLVLKGDMTAGGERLDSWSWGRLPAGLDLHAETGAQGAEVWMKLGPLLHPDVCKF
jgi:quercetin dioxygenase-like cupin family protein